MNKAKQRALAAAAAAAVASQAATAAAKPAPPRFDWSPAAGSVPVNFHPGVDMAAWVAAARQLGPRGEIHNVTITKKRPGGVSARDELRKFVYEPRVSRSGLRPAK